MTALQYFLYVTLDDEGYGVIEDSFVLAGVTEDCETETQLAPLDDDMEYSSDLNLGLTVQPTMVTGHPNWSPYVGQDAGGWSITGSSFFSFFPESPEAAIAEFQLYGDIFAACYSGVDDLGLPACYNAGGWVFTNTHLADGTPTGMTEEYCASLESVWLPGLGCITGSMELAPGSDEAHDYCGAVACAPALHGYPGMPHPGATAGYVIDDVGFEGVDEDGNYEWKTSFAPSNQGSTADLHVEWHYIDGTVSQTGLGDVVGLDEDGDGTDHDNILGYPALVATYMNPAPACGGYTQPILGDLTEQFAGTPLEACIDHVAEANVMYLMDASLAQWGGFLTWNAVMYQLSQGDASFLVDDSAAEMNPADIFYMDVTTGETGCTPTTGGPTDPCQPINLNGGRLVMSFAPTCIPVVSSISVQGELTSIGGECDSGDTDGNGSVDVLDVVSLVSFILGQTDSIDCGDINSDGNVDVLDVVAMVSQILSPRGEEASSATFTKTEDGVSMASNGVVGAVQMTLLHDSDFSIDLTDNAFVAEYHTEGSTTTLIVVNPTEDMLFEATGDFTVEEAVAATTDGYINTNVNIPDAITLGAAYPNPFNPSTSFELNVNQAGDISVMIYNVNGQVVDVLHQGYKDAGVHSMTLNGQNLSSGMYIVKATSADVTVSQKVMLIK